ncbi:MAG TPA: stage III sporulation protein AC [Clostridiales bacterium]|nr:stage III sporulation protein AC [Clostridiales bacterium]HBE14385.1 stage III sporulation protein AC [Clostridiales bacterium]HCG35431.1 stage III sporulation protein AC [Clostridiales bacterium]
MDISLILKIAGIGLLVSVVCQILRSTGRDDQATFVSVAGILLVLFLLLDSMDALFTTIQKIFGL